MNKLLKKMKDNQGGFTLVELIVVIAIIGILASVLMPKFTGFTDRAKKTEVMSDAKHIYTAFETIKVETNEYPVADDVDYTKAAKSQFKDLIPKADVTNSDGNSGVVTLGPDDNIFTYKKTVKGVAFTAICDDKGEITVLKD